MSSWHHPTPAAPSPSLASINEHKQAPVQWLAAPPSTPVVVQETTPEKESQAEVPKWGWGAGRRERREHRLEPVQQPWSERKQDMASMKQEADEKVCICTHPIRRSQTLAHTNVDAKVREGEIGSLDESS